MVALVLLIILLPVALVVAVVIRLESPGPVLVSAHRVGRNGRLLKLRESRVGYLDNADIRLNRAEGIVFGGDARFG